MNDYLVHGLSADGSLRIISALTTNLTEDARKIHNTSPVATAALGRVMTGTKMIGSMLKNERDSLTVNFKGDGPLGTVMAVTDGNSTIKGYVENPGVDIPLNKKGKLDVGRAVGKNGYLSIIRDIGLKEPYTGSIPLVNGEIAEDFTKYFAVSEQIPTAVSLGVLIDTDGTVKASGGYIIQLMPEADSKTIERIEKLVKRARPVTEYIEGGLNPEDLICEVLEGFMLFFKQQKEIFYKCDCTSERVIKAIISLGNDEIEKIFNEQGKLEITCHFCNKKYSYDNLEKLIEIISA